MRPFPIARSSHVSREVAAAARSRPPQRSLAAQIAAAVRAEALEARRLLAITFADNEVIVIGEDTADTVAIELAPGAPALYQVTHNGVAETFPIAEVARFRVATFGGDDSVNIGSAAGVVPVDRFVDLGLGNDTYGAGAGRDFVGGGFGDDLILTGSGQDRINSGMGNDTVAAGSGADFINGAEDVDLLIGTGGGDTILGDAGNDTLLGGSGSDTLDAGAGDDVIVGSNGGDSLFGDNGADSLQGSSGDDILVGGDGADTLLGAGGSDTLAGDGELRLGFFDLDEELTPLSGNDVIDGGAGTDRLLGFTGVDEFIGGFDEDFFDARGDDDLLVDRDPLAEPLVGERVFTGEPGVTRDAIIRANVIGPDLVPRRVFFPVGTGALAGGTTFAEMIDEFGTVRFRDLTARDFTIGEFFDAAGLPFGADRFGPFVGSPIGLTIDGVPVTDFENAVIGEGDIAEVTVGPVPDLVPFDSPRLVP